MPFASRNPSESAAEGVRLIDRLKYIGCLPSFLGGSLILLILRKATHADPSGLFVR